MSARSRRDAQPDLDLELSQELRVTSAVVTGAVVGLLTYATHGQKLNRAKPVEKRQAPSHDDEPATLDTTCHRCGADTHLGEGPSRSDYATRFRVDTGYASERLNDGITVGITLCERCVARWLRTFRHPPVEVQDYLHMGHEAWPILFRSDKDRRIARAKARLCADCDGVGECATCGGWSGQAGGDQ